MMDLVRQMEWSLYDKRVSVEAGTQGETVKLSGWLSVLLLGFLFLPTMTWAAPLPQHDVNEISRLGQSRGLSNEQVNRLVDQAKQAGDRGLPPQTILNKIKEGLAKGVPPTRVAPVLKDMVGKLETARDVLRDVASSGKGRNDGRQHAMEVLAEALGRGVKPDDVRALGRAGGKGKLNRESLAFGAKGLALTKEAGLSGKDGISLVGEAVRQGYRPNEILDLGREVKKHGREFREDRSRIRSLKKAIERGERLDKIFRDKSRNESRRGKGGEKSFRDRERKESRDREDVRKQGREREDRERVRGNGGGSRENRIERRESRERIRSSDSRPERRDRSGSESGRRGRDH